MDKKEPFLTDDIRIEEVSFYGNDMEHCELTENIDDALRFIIDNEHGTEEERAEAKALLSQFERNPADACEVVRDWLNEHDDLYSKWRDDITDDEQYQVPMMNAIRWYPSFVSFDEADRYKCSGAICLVHDTESDRWGVAMSGGGMDLAPHLLDTFIALESGVPSELASSIRADYPAYVNAEKHRQNCNMLARAYANEAYRSIAKVAELYRPIEKKGDHDASETINNLTKRHIQGLQKALAEYIR